MITYKHRISTEKTNVMVPFFFALIIKQLVTHKILPQGKGV